MSKTKGNVLVAVLFGLLVVGLLFSQRLSRDEPASRGDKVADACDFERSDRRANVLYVGWLGFDNLGDELLWHVAQRLLVRYFESVHWTVSVWAPKQSELLAMLATAPEQRHLPRFDAVVLGGGSLLSAKHLELLDEAMRATDCQRLLVFGSGFDNYDPVRLSTRRIDDYLASWHKKSHYLQLALCRELAVPVSAVQLGGGVRGDYSQRLLASCAPAERALPVLGDAGVLVADVLRDDDEERQITACTLQRVQGSARDRCTASSNGDDTCWQWAAWPADARQWFAQRLADVVAAAALQRQRAGHAGPVALLNWGEVGAVDGLSSRQQTLQHSEHELVTAMSIWLATAPSLVLVVYAMSPGDVDAVLRVAAAVGDNVPSARERLIAVERAFVSTADLLRLFDVASLSIALKLHASVTAMSAGVSNIMLRYRLKSADLLSVVGPQASAYALPVSHLRSGVLLAMIDRLLQDPQPQLAEFLRYKQHTWRAHASSIAAFFANLTKSPHA